MANKQPKPRGIPRETFTLAMNDYLNIKVEQLNKFDKNKVTARRAIALEQIRKAVGGDQNSTKEVMDRTEGKPIESVKHEGGLEIKITNADDV